MAEATIRRMTVRDFGEVYELGLRCYDASTVPYNYWSITEVAQHLETSPGLCLVGEEDGRVVGFILGDESFEGDRETAYLEWLAVDAERRRQGLGRRLTETALAGVKELGKARVVVDIADGNEQSRALAEELGFEEGPTVRYFSKRLG
jgi:ribosomal protein S18 acetylase RimI-like enzyme